MKSNQKATIDSPIGNQEIDSLGSPIGVVRVDAEKSYANTGKLLQKYINEGDKSAWSLIKSKIDYIFSNLDFALLPLDQESMFSHEIHARIKRGQKLLFKPNIVTVQNIDPQTHGPGPMSTACTEWPFIAALMRWFHDKLDVSYHQMSLGEAATAMPGMASYYSMINPSKAKITPEATLEGRSGDFFGGWGFYFVRQYLSECLDSDAADDPMNGYDESISGTYIPPGQVSDKLMVYDLNRIFDDVAKGREVEVAGGVNYKTITLHKVIVGGDPEDLNDLTAYPGCILVNVPKFKVHAITLFTNVIKNLGIGLYPMQHAKCGGHQWDYSVPRQLVPGMKGGIPHEVWVSDVDPDTGLSKRDGSGNYVVSKTGGITATMIDIIKAVKDQNIFMLHVVDGIECINIDHTGSPSANKVPEGMIFAGIDPIATDLLCARYMFSNVPIKEAYKSGLEDGNGGIFPQEVPVPKVEGSNIITGTGYDCPLMRDICFQKAEERGLGKRLYYVVGQDRITNSPMISLHGHLGIIKDNAFSDLITKTLYFDLFKLPWDLQKTAFNYMAAVDKLEGSSIKDSFMEAYDENGSGTVSYEEFGKKGAWGSLLYIGGEGITTMGTEKLGYLKYGFSRAAMLKNSDSTLNPDGHDLYKDMFIGTTILAAYRISRLDMEGPDPFVPGLTWGKGKWPSYQLAKFFQTGVFLYGDGFPYNVAAPSLYSAAFFYANHIQNDGRYAGEIQSKPNPKALEDYISGVLDGNNKPLDFTFFVPAGYGILSGKQIPNVEATEDTAKVLTVVFEKGKEIWK